MLEKLITGPILSIIDKFIPNQDEKNKFMLELEKNRFNVLSKLIERGAIPSILYLYIVLVFNKCLFSPWVSWFLEKPIPIFEIPLEITDLVKYLTIALLSKKVIDKRVKK